VARTSPLPAPLSYKHVIGIRREGPGVRGNITPQNGSTANSPSIPLPELRALNKQDSGGEREGARAGVWEAEYRRRCQSGFCREA